MNTSNNNLSEFIKDKFNEIKEWVLNNLRIVLPAAVAVLALIIFVIAMTAHKSKVAETQAEEKAQNTESKLNPEDVVITIPEIPLEEDAYPELNELINRYYKAMADGDIDTILELNNNVDDTEKIRIEETTKYVDRYESIKVYSKVGPTEGTYLAYVSSELKFKDYDTPVPGMKAFYVCTDENGKLYINDGEESETVTNYIREASLQDNVKELNNTVAASYNDMLAENEDLMAFLVDLTDTIDTAVGEALAQNEGTASTDEEEQQEASAEETEETEEQNPVATVVTTVKATTTVNVRSSDSETADKLGKATEGQEFKLIEKRGNGWSEIEYNGKSAFIKTEFLEDAATETVVTVPEDGTANSDTAADTTSAANTTASGTVQVKENVRIRSSASEDGDKIATAYVGEKLELVEKLANGWTKIKYKGQIAYVKSDYVE